MVVATLLRGTGPDGKDSMMHVEEHHVREWFKTVDIEQARDTFRVVEGILEMRGTGRKRRKDAGRTRQVKLIEDNQELMGS
jgi:hypothetical protein